MIASMIWVLKRPVLFYQTFSRHWLTCFIESLTSAAWKACLISSGVKYPSPVLSNELMFWITFSTAFFFSQNLATCYWTSEALALIELDFKGDLDFWFYWLIWSMIYYHLILFVLLSENRSRRALMSAS